MAGYACFLSCEHGGNKIPPAFQSYFEGQEYILQSHRGWDPGTLALAQYLSRELEIPLVSCTVSRLLIEMNRSLGHPQLFSEFSASLSNGQKAQLFAKYYYPYREKIKSNIERNIIHEKATLHFSIHSFTPILNGHTRMVDIGLLFDPSRSLELLICTQIQNELQKQLPDMQIKFNEPYLGIDDGLTTYLRVQYEDKIYAGIEMEINQKWVGTEQFTDIKQALKNAISSLQIRKPVTK